MSSTNPDEPSDRELLLNALRGFVDQYDTDRRAWPDDMVELLDEGHYALAVATGKSRADY